MFIPFLFVATPKVRCPWWDGGLQLCPLKLLGDHDGAQLLQIPEGKQAPQRVGTQSGAAHEIHGGDSLGNKGTGEQTMSVDVKFKPVVFLLYSTRVHLYII